MPIHRKRNSSGELASPGDLQSSAAAAAAGDEAGDGAVASSPMNPNIVLTNEMGMPRVAEETRKDYARILEYIKKHCASKIPGSCDADGELILPMADSTLAAFLSDMAKPIDATGRVKAFQTLNSYVSALKFFYKERGIAMSEEVDTYLKSWLSGFKRKIADLKQSGVMKNFEGKLPMSYVHYNRLTQLALFAADIRSAASSFVHLFAILCWNLFARSCSIADLHFQHLSWQNDSLVVDMSMHNADHTGGKVTPKHVYANPYSPASCPILALGLHVFSIATRLEGQDKQKVFLSTTPNDTFTKWLMDALKNLSNLGYEVSDFGAHSFRKGIASYVGGFIGGPGIISVYLRAGWSLGQVQDRHLTYSEGGDELCGRVACGLNFNDGSQFSVLPPAFANGDAVIPEQKWNEILPGYGDYPASFRSCLPFLVASVAFHYDWLVAKDDVTQGTKNISQHHPIFRSRLFTSRIGEQSLIQWLRDQVLPLNTSGRCSSTGMTATGIPPHIDTARKIEQLEAENRRLQELLARNHNEVMQELPQRITNSLRGTTTTSAMQQMTAPELRTLLRELIAAEREAARPPIPAPEVAQPAAAPSLFQIDSNGYGSWMWRGKFRAVPPESHFELGTAKEICDFFMFGKPVQHIRPYRLMTVSDWAHKDQQFFNKSKYVFHHICSIALKEGIVSSPEDIYSMDYQRWDRLYKQVFDVIAPKVQAIKKRRLARPEEKSILTVYDWFISDAYKSQYVLE